MRLKWNKEGFLFLLFSYSMNIEILYWEDKCTCKDWFKWNVWKTKCVEDSANTYNKWAKNDGLSTTTTNGVLWKYNI